MAAPPFASYVQFNRALDLNRFWEINVFSLSFFYCLENSKRLSKQQQILLKKEK